MQSWCDCLISMSKVKDKGWRAANAPLSQKTEAGLSMRILRSHTSLFFLFTAQQVRTSWETGPTKLLWPLLVGGFGHGLGAVERKFSEQRARWRLCVFWSQTGSTCKLGDLGEVIQPLWASVFTQVSGKWNGLGITSAKFNVMMYDHQWGMILEWSMTMMTPCLAQSVCVKVSHLPVPSATSF